MQGSAHGYSNVRWLILVGLVLAVILVPAFIFGAAMDSWAESIIHAPVSDKAIQGTILGLLLVVDIVVPVPSSVVSTALGVILGWAPGCAISTLGMTAASWLGYRLGQGAGRGAAHRMVSERQLAWLETASERWGSAFIALFRAVPVLAEASSFFAGMSRMPAGRYMAISILSNAGISAVYTAVGAYSANVNSFPLAFIGALLLPGLAMWANGRMRDSGAPAIRSRT